jgi:membrane-bound lytic murein transglycosylase B
MRIILENYLPSKKFFLVNLILFILMMGNVKASYAQDWAQWVQDLRQEAMGQGIKPGIFDTAFAGVTPNQTVLHLDKHQPEKRLTFLQYRTTRIDPLRIKLGRIEYKRYQALMGNIGHDYGVDPCFITAFWGIETSYGHYLGHFPVVRALATLAYDNRRSDYFRKELLIALHILNEGHVSLDKFKGEWAGASGQPQFMPSSWQRYAVDYEGDGRRNIWTSYPDAFASIANYLHLNGWLPRQPWAVQVSLPTNFNDDWLGLRIAKPVSEWLRLGVTIVNSQRLPPDQDLLASIVRPEGGPDFMVFNNFKVLLKYNNSIFYAASVGYLADKICSR